MVTKLANDQDLTCGNLGHDGFWYTGKVGPAHTEDTAYYFFAPKVGVVAMISQEDVEAYWIIHIDTTTGKVLASQ